MNQAFLIDNRKCIGCHACSTACKAENEVPLGVHRTWVKYVEKGAFPDTRRYFQVTRCNHCAKPPCVPICPTTAMYRREDGIVEFDSQRCIGCKACLQACPYDAIHIDPESGTAAKCHFCAHRVDAGLEPACVIVCPVHAIISGDLDEPRSEIARLLSTQNVAVRKPEQGTRPKLFYIDAEASAISPGFATQQSAQLWSEAPAWGPSDWRGPIQTAPGRMADALLRSRGSGGPQGPLLGGAPRETYNVPHRIPWHWQVPAYLVTKALGSGIFLIAAAGLALGLLPAMTLFTTAAPLAALLFIALTGALLVGDLDRPERFWTILTRPQWRSWLTRGAFLLGAYGLLLSIVVLAQMLGQDGIAAQLRWPGVILAVLSAVYTAFLFAQAEGRDLWQSPLLSAHLLVQAVMAGAAGLLLLGLFVELPVESIPVLVWTFGLALAANLLLTVGGEFAVPHASSVASAAARMITHGRYAPQYRGSLAGGLLLPLAAVIAWPAAPAVHLIASLLSLGGLLAYEWAFVFAPQQIPNS